MCVTEAPASLAVRWPAATSAASGSTCILRASLIAVSGAGTTVPRSHRETVDWSTPAASASAP